MNRKSLTVGVFSLCCLALVVSESQAFWGLLHPHHPYSLWNHRNRYVTHITVRPYNAFTPIAWGNLVCDGCVPNPCGVASGCLPMTMGVPPFASNGMGCGPMCMGDVSMASDMPPPGWMPMPMPMPGHMPHYGPPPIRNDSFVPPAPQPTPPPAGPGFGMMSPYGVTLTNYPGYYPPMYYPQPMPYYWYGVAR